MDVFLNAEDGTKYGLGVAFPGMTKYRDSGKEKNKSIAGAIVLMFIAGMGIAWVVFSTIFPQGILTFLILLAYVPITGIIAVFLYFKFKR